jgi:hypothetical protein
MSFPNYAVQRQFTRYSLDVRAKLNDGRQEITVRTTDISEGGVGVISPVEIALEAVFNVEMSFPTVQGVFCARLKTQRRSGFRYGLQFVEVDESNLELYRKFQRRWGILADDSYASKG